MSGLDTPLTSEEIERVQRANWRRYYSVDLANRQAGFCRNPIHLAPKYKGEWMGPTPDTVRQNGYEMTYPIRCGSRLAERCPSCSILYGIDANRLVYLGLAGDGDNVPLTVSQNPALWSTLTLPSLGPVHHYVERQPGKPGICHPGKRTFCEHGTLISCGKIHKKDDPELGTPLCPDCYGLEDQVLANATAPELWDRFLNTELPRALAKVLKIPARKLQNYLKIEAVKTSEMQGRLAVHFHACIRLDGPGSQGSAPKKPVTDAGLVKAFQMAVSRTVIRKTFTTGKGDLSPVTREFRFGKQVDVVSINAANAKFFANYTSKYATKSATEAAGFAREFRSLKQILAIPDKDWWPRLMACVAFKMGEDPRYKKLRLAEHAHTFGYGGWFITKTRRWSVTFGMLKQLRVKWVLDHLDRENPEYTNVDPSLFENEDITWAPVAFGWLTPLDARFNRMWWKERVRAVQDYLDDLKFFRELEAA